MKVVGLLLAGGQSRRMGGGDKALRLLGGIPLLERVIERLRPQVDALVLNANGDPTRFANFALPVAADTVPGFVGPLAGVLAGLDWAASHRPDCPYVVSAATDAPFLPIDLVVRLAEALDEAGADLACAASGGRSHPVFGLWPVRLRDDLRRAVVMGEASHPTHHGMFRILDFVQRAPERFGGLGIEGCQGVGVRLLPALP